MSAQTSLLFHILAKDDASRKFADVGRSATLTSRAVGGTGHAFATLGKVAGVAALGLGAVGVAGGLAGIKTAAAMEQAQIGFTTLLHSGAKAQAFLTQMKTFAAATPFTFPGLVQASRQLLGAGAAAKSVIPTLTAFGDAAGALGLSEDNFNHIMLATTQAMAAGKLQAGDLLQITEAGLPIWKLLSEALGKPIPALRKLSQQGKLLTADVLPKLQKQMEKDYGGSMAKQSQSLAGLWSTLTDTLNLGLASALQPLVPILKDAMPGAMKILASALKGLATGLSGTITWVQNIVAWFHKGKGAAGEIGGIVRSLGGWFKNELWPALQTGVMQILPGLKDAFHSVSNTIQSNRSFFAELGRIITGALIPALSLAVRTIIGLVGPAFKTLVFIGRYLVVPAFKFILQTWFTLVGALVNGAAKALGWIPGIGPKLKKAAAAFNRFRDDVNAALSGIHSQKTIDIRLRTTNIQLVSNGLGIGDKRGRGGGKGPHRALGGRVRVGQQYTVGENGEEQFIPDANGRIEPRGRGGGGNVYITIQAGVSDPLGTAKALEQVFVKLRRTNGGRPLAFQ